MYGSVFDHPDFAGHEDVHFVNGDAAGMQAVIAVHSTRLGPALGGTRYLRYAEPAHAVADALRLSSGMTAKAAMAGLPLGGGKAVILADPSADKTAVLTAYARQVSGWAGDSSRARTSASARPRPT